MSRTDPNSRTTVTLSILDRLKDELPPPTRTEALRRLKRSVSEDLELLLNTRQTRELPEDLKELNNSVAAFGMPDLSTLNAKNAAERFHLINIIETLIAKFEPRLREVSVSVEPEGDDELAKALEVDRALHFRIDAHLVVDPAPEPVVFDTTFRLHSGDYKVRGDG